MAGQVELERIMIRLIGDGTLYFRMLRQAQKETDSFAQQVRRSFIQIAAVSSMISVPLISMGKASVNAFRTFDQAMTEATSIMGNLDDATKESMRSVAKELSGQVAQAPADLAKAFYFMASAGFSAKQAIAALPAVSKFATAGAFDLEKATSLAVDAQTSLGMRSENSAKNLQNLTRVMDVLARANEVSNASLEQLSVSMTRQAGGALRAFNKDVEEGAAVLAVFANQGIKGETAGNQLSMVLRHLSKTAIENSAAYEQILGKNAVFDKAGNFRNMADIIETLEKNLDHLSPQMKATTLLALGFQARMQQSILPLLGNSKAIRQFEDEFRKAGGTMDRVASEQMKSFNNQMLMLQNNLTVLAIELGELIAPAFVMVGSAVKEVVTWFRELPVSTKSIIVGIAAVTAAFFALTAAIAIAGFTFNLLFGGIGIITGSIITGMAAVAVALGGVVVYLGGIQETIDAIAYGFAYMAETALQAWEWIRPVRLALWSLVKFFINNTIEGFQIVWRYIVTGWNGVMKGLSNLMQIFGINTKLDLDRIRDAFVETILQIEFGFRNVMVISDLLWAGAKYGAVAFGNEVEHFFKNTIPAIAAWFAANWPAMIAAAWIFGFIVPVKFVVDKVVALIDDMVKKLEVIIFETDWEKLYVGLKESTQRNVMNVIRVFANIGNIATAGAAGFKKFWTERKAEAGVGAEGIMDKLRDIGANIDLDKMGADFLDKLPDKFEKFLNLRIKPLVLPEREMGGLEKQLKEEFERQKGALKMSWEEFRKMKLEEFAKKGLIIPGLKDDEKADFDKRKDQLDNFTQDVGSKLKALDATIYGSAESISRIAEYVDMLREGAPRKGAGAKTGAAGALKKLGGGGPPPAPPGGDKMDKDMLEELISGRKLLQKILDKPNNLGLELANF